MRITKEELEILPNGTELKIFLSGSDWEEDFGKSMTVFKFGNQLFEYKPFCKIEDIDSGDKLDIQAAIDINIVNNKFSFEPVKDKPGYYWLNKRNYQIISEEVLKKAIKEYEASHKLFLPDSEFHS